VSDEVKGRAPATQEAATLGAAIRRKADESAAVITRFFAAQAGPIEACARAMAAAFAGGGRLYAFGNGGSACDAQHVAVEFMHPIVEKRRPLPAQALSADPALITAVGNDTDFSRVFADALRRLARPGDLALGLSTSGKASNVVRGFQAARELGLMTVALTGKDGGKLPPLADHCFVVPSYAIHRIQEVHVALLHVLWDLVHVVMGEDDVL
jgi:D-sedoheptulose 7-phosphate isomerase